MYYYNIVLYCCRSVYLWACESDVL